MTDHDARVLTERIGGKDWLDCGEHDLSIRPIQIDSGLGTPDPRTTNFSVNRRKRPRDQNGKSITRTRLIHLIRQSDPVQVDGQTFLGAEKQNLLSFVTSDMYLRTGRRPCFFENELNHFKRLVEISDDQFKLKILNLHFSTHHSA
jgi:hypothetical protein